MRTIVEYSKLELQGKPTPSPFTEEFEELVNIISVYAVFITMVDYYKLSAKPSLPRAPTSVKSDELVSITFLFVCTAFDDYYRLLPLENQN